MLFNIMNMFTEASELLSGPLPQMMKGSLEPIYTEQMSSGFKIHLVHYRKLYLNLFYTKSNVFSILHCLRCSKQVNLSISLL